MRSAAAHFDRYRQPADLLSAVEAPLRRNESQNSLMLGKLYGAVSGERGVENFIGVGVMSGTRVLGAALRTTPDSPLLLTPMSPAVVERLVETLDRAGVQLTGVRAVRDTSVDFAQGWARRRRLAVRVGMQTYLHELTAVNMPDLGAGRLRVASVGDESLLMDFLVAFFQETEAAANEPVRRARGVIKRLLRRNRMHLWCDDAGRIVSTASIVRETPNGASLSLVYTPPQYRGMGHASRLVASLSQRVIDGGRALCSLYTDVANPTSNAIYARIGYRRLAEDREHHFMQP